MAVVGHDMHVDVKFCIRTYGARGRNKQALSQLYSDLSCLCVIKVTDVFFRPGRLQGGLKVKLNSYMLYVTLTYYRRSALTTVHSSVVPYKFSLNPEQAIMPNHFLFY